MRDEQFVVCSRDKEREQQSSARRRALLYRGFASASSSHVRPRSLLRPHTNLFEFDSLHSAKCALPTRTLVAAAPAEPSFEARRKASSPVATPLASAGKPAAASGCKLYPEPAFKGLLSAMQPKALTITIVKCYALAFGNLMFGAEMEEQSITDDQINAAHKASLELVIRELATTTLRRVLEKCAILALDRRWSTKLLKDVSASAKRKAMRDGRLSAAGHIALTSFRSSLLVHIATWTVEALVDIVAMLRGRIRPKACARMILHRALNRLICAFSGAAGASLLTLVFPGMGTFIGALLAESAAPYITAALLGDVHQLV